MKLTYYQISDQVKNPDNEILSVDRITCDTFSLKNHTQILVEKLFPDSFLENQNLAYLWINSLEIYTVCFYCMPSYVLSKNVETKLQTTCFYLIYSFLKKQQRDLELVSLTDFVHYFWRKIFLLLHSINWPNFIVWLPLLREIFSNLCIVIVC